MTGAVILSDSAKKKLVSEIRDQIISNIKQNGLIDSDEITEVLSQLKIGGSKFLHIISNSIDDIIAREEEQVRLSVRDQKALKKLKLIRDIISFFLKNKVSPIKVIIPL